MKSKPIILNNPYIHDRLASLRDEDCSAQDFKMHVEQISHCLAYEAAQFIMTRSKTVKTPVEQMTAEVMDMPKSPLLVPILRAGLGLVKGFETLYHDCSTGHIGVYRDEETKRPVEYLVKLPTDLKRTIFLLDPMLATGHSAIYAADLLIEKGADLEHIIAVFLIAAPEGLEEFQAKHPTIHIVCGAVDSHLNEKAYIVPGLGDAGDRLFGTY